MLLNYAIFAWFGAVCPWSLFAHSGIISIGRLIGLGVLVLLLRRIPIVYALHFQIRQIQGLQQCLITGFFGPIGVSAIFYLSVSLEFLRHVTVEGIVREDAAMLAEDIEIVVWFLVMCSIVSNTSELGHLSSCLSNKQVGHGLSVPLGKLGLKSVGLIRSQRGKVKGSPGAEDFQESQESGIVELATISQTNRTRECPDGE